jgi:hypothetical protein
MARRYLSGAGSAIAEGRRKLAAQRRLERVFARPIRAELDRASAEIVAVFAATGAVGAVPVDHEERLRAIYAELYATSIRTVGERILSPGQASAGLVLEVKSFAELFARLAFEFIALEVIRRRIRRVADATRAAIVNAVRRGQTEGDPLDVIARRLTRDVPAINRQRAAVIARTETHAAANHAANEAANASGLVLRKEWIPTQDHRTRDFLEPVISFFDHRSMAGQVVDNGAFFRVPSLAGVPELMLHPGDPNGSAGNVINCRCQLGHIVVE